MHTERFPSLSEWRSIVQSKEESAPNQKTIQLSPEGAGDGKKIISEKIKILKLWWASSPPLSETLKITNKTHSLCLSGFPRGSRSDAKKLIRLFCLDISTVVLACWRVWEPSSCSVNAAGYLSIYIYATDLQESVKVSALPLESWRVSEGWYHRLQRKQHSRCTHQQGRKTRKDSTALLTGRLTSVLPLEMLHTLERVSTLS